MSFQVEPLDGFHERKAFTCGKSSLDHYIRNQVNQDFKKKLAVCFVIADRNHNVMGYYTISSSLIQVDTAPLAIKLKSPQGYKALPVILLGRLAVDVNLQGQGLGELLLTDAITRVFEASKKIGSMAIVADPLDEEAIRFYEKYGFIKLSSGRMFLSLKTVLQFFPKR